MIGDIHRIESFTIENTTYHYWVEGICYAESPLSAKRGLQAYSELPSGFQSFLRNEVKLDLLVLVQDSVYLDAKNRVGHWKLALGTQEAMIRLASGEKSAEVIASKLMHELDHHFRFRTGELAEVNHKAEGIAIPKTVGHNSTDPTYLTSSRKTFQKNFFADLHEHMQAHGLKQIDQIQHPAAKIVFQKPMQEYFYPEIKMGLKNLLLKKGLPYSMDYTLAACAVAERHWFNQDHPISTLISTLKKYYPELSLHEIRAVVSSASLTTRIEISAHHVEASLLYPNETKNISPRMSYWLEKTTAQRAQWLNPKPVIPQPTHLQVPVFANIQLNDIHNPLPEVAYVTLDEVRHMGYGGMGYGVKPVCLKYVILETGELLLAKQYSKLMLLTPMQREHYRGMNLAVQGFARVKGVETPFAELYNGDIIYFDAKGKTPLSIIIPVKHPEVAGLRNVIAAGDAYVCNGRICLPRGRMNEVIPGLNDWTGHYLVYGNHLKDLVEGTFRQHGFLEAKYYSLAEKIGRTKLLHKPNIINSALTIKNPNAKPVITIDVGPSKTNFSSVGKKLSHRGMVGLTIVANVIEYGDVPAGVLATATELGVMGALQVFAKPLPLLPLTIMGALPDVKAEFEKALHESEVSESSVCIKEMPAAQQAAQSLLYGNPWGADRGLTHSSMTPHQQAKIVMMADPERLSGYFWQQVGQKINEAVHGTGKIAAAIVAIINPFSCASSLYAPDRYDRFEVQPGYVFVDALRWAETKTNYQPNLAEETCLRMIGAILAANQVPPETVSLPPITNPIDPQQLRLQAKFPPGYQQGPKFKLENNRIPTWVKGVGIAVSATGWQVSLTTQLSLAFLGAGGVVLLGGGIAGYFSRKKASKQEIHARNSKRVKAQCDAIDAEINKISQKIDDVVALGNRYFTEINPTTKQALYTELTQTLATLKAENKAQQDLNAERSWNKNLHVDGHKIRLRTRDYCKTLQSVFIENGSILDELENKILTHQKEIVEIAEINRKAQRAFDERQRVANLLSITSDVAAIAKNTLTLFMPEKPKPVVVIPMTKSDHITPAHMSLWQAPRKQAIATNDVKKLPISVSDHSSTKPQPIKAFKL